MSVLPVREAVARLTRATVLAILMTAGLAPDGSFASPARAADGAPEGTTDAIPETEAPADDAVTEETALSGVALSGRSLTISRGPLGAVWYFSPDGALFVMEPAGLRWGSWRMQDTTFCRSYIYMYQVAGPVPDQTPERCYEMLDNGVEVLVKPQGGGRALGTVAANDAGVDPNMVEAFTDVRARFPNVPPPPVPPHEAATADPMPLGGMTEPEPLEGMTEPGDGDADSAATDDDATTDASSPVNLLPE